MANDASFAIVDALRAAGVADGRVWRPRIPQTEASEMPRRAVVVRQAGGGVLGGGYLPVTDRRVDVRCYGADAEDSALLAGGVAVLLHRIRDLVVPSGRILWCTQAGGLTDLVESDTSWPLTLSSWQVAGSWLD